MFLYDSYIYVFIYLLFIYLYFQCLKNSNVCLSVHDIYLLVFVVLDTCFWMYFIFPRTIVWTLGVHDWLGHRKGLTLTLRGEWLCHKVMDAAWVFLAARLPNAHCGCRSFVLCCKIITTVIPNSASAYSSWNEGKSNLASSHLHIFTFPTPSYLRLRPLHLRPLHLQPSHLKPSHLRPSDLHI